MAKQNVVSIGDAPKVHMWDTFANFLAGLGIAGKDKAVSQQFVLPILSQMELEAAYRGDWVSRKAVDIPALDCTRMWRNWQADKGDITKLEEGERNHAIQRKTFMGLQKSRLYGGAVMILGVTDDEFHMPLNLDKVTKDSLKFVHVVERWQIHAGPLVRDILDPRFGQPAYYLRTRVPVGPDILAQFNTAVNANPEQLLSASFKYDPGAMVVIHPSRVVRLIGNEYPDMERAPDAWGDSILQTIHDTIRDSGLVSQSIAAMVAEAKVDVFRIPGLAETLSTERGTNKLISRFQHANVAKSVVNALLLDITEEFERKELNATQGLSDLGMFYLALVCAAVDVPATRFLGKSPDGMNATGESDMRNYYDRIKSDQQMRLQPAMNVLDEVMLRSTFGTRPDDMFYIWNSLWQMDDAQRADMALKKAQAFQIDMNSNMFHPQVMMKARLNQLIEDGTYPGLEQIADEHDQENFDPDAYALQKMQQQGEAQNEIAANSPDNQDPPGGGGKDKPPKGE